MKAEEHMSEIGKLKKLKKRFSTPSVVVVMSFNRKKKEINMTKLVHKINADDCGKDLDQCRCFAFVSQCIFIPAMTCIGFTFFYVLYLR